MLLEARTTEPSTCEERIGLRNLIGRRIWGDPILFESLDMLNERSLHSSEVTEPEIPNAWSEATQSSSVRGYSPQHHLTVSNGKRGVANIALALALAGQVEDFLLGFTSLGLAHSRGLWHLTKFTFSRHWPYNTPPALELRPRAGIRSMANCNSVCNT